MSRTPVCCVRLHDIRGLDVIHPYGGRFVTLGLLGKWGVPARAHVGPEIDDYRKI